MAHLGNTIINGIMKVLGDSYAKRNNAAALNNFITGTGTAAQDKGSGVTPRYFPAKWTFNTGCELKNGDLLTVKSPLAGHDYGTFMSIDGGTTYKPIARDPSGTTRTNTQFGAGSHLLLVYQSDGTVNSVYPVDGGNDRVNVSGGCWRVVNYYDTGNTYDRNRFQVAIKAWGTALVKYNIIVAGIDGTYHHLKEGTVFDMKYPILYLNADVAAGDTTTNTYDCIPFTVTTTQSITLTPYKMVYIKGQMDFYNCTFTPNGTAPLTQTIPTSEDTFEYLELGYAYSTTAIYLTSVHRVYMFTQNRFGECQSYAVTTKYLQGRQVTDSVTQNDTNLVSSGGVYTAIDAAINQVLNAQY